MHILESRRGGMQTRQMADNYKAMTDVMDRLNQHVMHLSMLSPTTPLPGMVGF